MIRRGETADEERERSYTWRSAGRATAILLAYSGQSTVVGVVALLMPLLQSDLDITFTQVGALSLASTVTYAAMQIPGGRLSERFGARRVFITGLSGLAATCFLVSACSSFGDLLINQIVAGVFRGCCFVPGLALITREFPVARRATAMSAYFACGFVSLAGLNAGGPWLANEVGWRTSFALVGAIGLGCVGIYAWLGGSGPATRRHVRSGRSVMAELLSSKGVWLASGVQFTRLAVVSSMLFWAPTYLVDEIGMTLGMAGVTLVACNLLALFAIVVGGYVSDRMRSPLRVIRFSLAVLAGTFVVLAVSQETWVVVSALSVQAMFMQAYTGSLFQVTAQWVSAAAVESLNGLGNFWANLGGLVMSFAIGVIRDRTGTFAWSWSLIAIMLVLACTAATAMQRLQRQSDADALLIDTRQT